MSLSDEISLAIAFFTALAAFAALWSANITRKIASDAHAQAKQMYETTLDATKANALATRIDYCGDPQAEAQAHGWNTDLRIKANQKEHLVYQLDVVLDRLGVGLGQPSDHSTHNAEIEDWKRLHAEALARAPGQTSPRS
jgi:hypothetical protein